MIEISPPDLRALARWFPTGLPGTATIAEHVLGTDVGRWWADRPVQPRTIAVSCAGHVALRGSAEELTPDVLASLAGNRVEAPPRFLPALGAAFDRLTPWERMIWTLQAAPQPSAVPRAVTVRRMEPADVDALRALGPDASWLSASWGGPRGFVTSGHAWAAVARTGRILSMACRRSHPAAAVPAGRPASGRRPALPGPVRAAGAPGSPPAARARRSSPRRRR
ncbi:GNAT family N-acetyltransferase [Streptomyces krungchingensis]